MNLTPCLAHSWFSVRQLAIVLWLFENDATKSRDIAKALNVPKPSVSRAIDGLCIMGLTERKRGKEDARDSWVKLTAKGREFARKIMG